MTPTTHESSTSVTVSVTVDVPVDYAFRTFTERFDEIKPRDHNLLDVPIERTVLEPRVGGTIYDVGIDGSTCAWARVLHFEPPHRLVISWDITPQWEPEPDHDRSSEIEITFSAEGDTRTRVELEHRHLDRHGDGWQEFLGLDTGNGWPLYLARFRAVAEAHSA